MSNINPDPRLPLTTSYNYTEELNRQLYIVLRELSEKLNSLSNGELVGTNNATTAAPTTGTYYQGDYVKNSAPTELGSASSKYIIKGWICTVSGTPGTWLQDRCLTGN